MTAVHCTILLRDIDREEGVRGLDAYCARRGYERVASPSLSEPHVMRAFVQAQGRWMACTLEELREPESLAGSLSRRLGCLALASWHWEDESATRLALFEKGVKVGDLELPRDARRCDARRVAVPLGALSRLVGDGSRQEGLELRIPVKASFVFVAHEEAVSAFQRAFGIEELVLDTDRVADVLLYRPKADSALGKRLRAAEDARGAELRAGYDARVFAVGWLAFAAKPTAALLSAVAQPIADAFDALGVLDARVVGASRTSTPTSRDWKRFASMLAKGELVELRNAVATQCFVYADGAFSMSFSVRGHKDRARRLDLAGRFDQVIDRAAEVRGCFGALVTAQQRALVLEQRALAYEYLRGKSERALRPVRTEARAPGWRTMVPKGLGTPPFGFTARQTGAGLLVASEVDEPWALPAEASDRLEAWLFD